MDNTNNYNDEVEIDLLEIFNAIKKYYRVIIILTLFFGVVTGIVTKFFIQPTYSSSATIFLTPTVGVEGNVDYTSLNSNQKLVNNVMSLLTQENIMTEVVKGTELQTTSEVRDVLSVTNKMDTELVTVTATTHDAKLSKDIVSITVNTFIDTMQENLNLKNIEIVNKPKLSYKKVGPSLKKNIAIGAAFGLILGLGYAVLKVLTDNRLKSKDEAEKYLGIPVFCELPVMDKNL